MNFKNTVVVFLLCTLYGIDVYGFAPKWLQKNDVRPCPGGYEVTGGDPWLLSENIVPTVGAERSYLKLTYKASKPATFFAYWWKNGEELSFLKMITFPLAQSETPTEMYVDLDKYGRFHGTDTLRIGPTGDKELVFDINDIDFITREQAPSDQLTHLIDFHCYTSKLHFQPGEIIEYKADLLAKNYPEKRSVKNLTVQIIDSAGKTVAESSQFYELHEVTDYKEIYGFFNLKKDLPAGKYELRARSVDQMTDFTLSANHIFSVIDANAPYIYETPFKYVKDFTITREPNGLWHIFSITGPFYAGHDWIPAGHERAFSHGTSMDLRNWNYHPPVLSISDAKYPDGNGFFENHGIWAPHIVSHKGIYYMFYTSVNNRVSQSISLATSKDLFEWTKYDKNPILTLENIKGLHWQRNGWADCRDPMVFSDNNKFYLYVTAHIPEGTERGAVVVAESNDLVSWHNPRVAVRGIASMESPQVWKEKGHYFMTTSALGAGTFISDSPVTGWKKHAFPRPSIQQHEKFVPTSSSYAEEAIRLDDGSLIMAGLTWRLWGNSIYIFEVCSDANGVPTNYQLYP
jgi:hypothetical protein